MRDRGGGEPGGAVAERWGPLGVGKREGEGENEEPQTPLQEWEGKGIRTVSSPAAFPAPFPLFCRSLGESKRDLTT